MEQNRRSSDRYVVLVVVGFLLMPLLYVLSIGPVFGLVTRDYISWRAYHVYASPWGYTGGRIEPLRVAMNRYAGWFCNPDDLKPAEEQPDSN